MIPNYCLLVRIDPTGHKRSNICYLFAIVEELRKGRPVYLTRGRDAEASFCLYWQADTDEVLDDIKNSCVERVGGICEMRSYKDIMPEEDLYLTHGALNEGTYAAEMFRRYLMEISSRALQQWATHVSAQLELREYALQVMVSHCMQMRGGAQSGISGFSCARRRVYTPSKRAQST